MSNSQVNQRRVNVGLPVDLHERVGHIAETTHRTIVGTLTWMTEQIERDLGIAPVTTAQATTPAAEENKAEPSVAR